MPSTLIDANLLLLLVVGRTDRKLLARHKRLQAFEDDDYDLLEDMLRGSGQLLLCSYVLAEVSNLFRHIAEPDRTRISAAFAQLVAESDELAIPAKRAVHHAAYPRLGLSDAALLTAAADGPTLLTADFDLHIAALSNRCTSVNYNHARAAWLN